MNSIHRLLLAGAAVMFLLAGCAGCDNPNATNCDPTNCATGCCDSSGQCQLGTADDACGTGGAQCAPCGSGDSCVAGVCGGAGGGTGGGGGGIGGGTGGGSGDGGIVVDPTDLNNPFKDSDCDGLTDAEEFGNVYPGGARTDPANSDSDGDGILDGVEAGRTTSVDTTCGFVGDADPTTRSIPTEADSDGDGLPDGLEDTNHDGRADSGETDATNPDSDLDGLKDGDEDADHDGSVDTGETDPRNRDTDGDFINDGVEKTVTTTDPTKADTDGDTCNDGAEDLNQNGTIDTGETDPNNTMDCGPLNNPDTDMDGIPNNVEDANRNGTVDPGETDPNNPDSDSDGLRDGVEDANHNGVVDSGETNPLRKDSDCDGLLDGPTQGAIMGEDQNANGAVDMGETDPRKRDTDGDGLTDGVERGVTAPNLADTTNCTSVPVDADPGTTSNPTNRDSDGDGIDDGAEDVNQNGRVDTGELDPGNGMDGTGPAGKVCTVMNLRPVLFKGEVNPDLQLGLPATFTETATMTSGGQARGLIGFDPTNNVAFIAWRQSAPGGATTPTADEAAMRAQVGGVGALSNITTQTFTSWDGIASLQAFYEQAGTTDLKGRANALANSLVGAGAGALMGSGGGAGPFQLQLQVLHRTNSAVVFVIALTPLANYAGTPIFTMSDTAGGSAVAQFGDANAYQCETFAPGNAKVDFLVVVDDSCSMAGSQGALATTATNIATSLNNSALDWRIGMVTSEYYLGTTTGNRNVLRGFTRNIKEFEAWLTQGSNCSGGTCTLVTPAPICNPTGGRNGGCWVTTSGTGSERILESAARATNQITPATATEQANRLRTGAQLVIILLGDADDYSGYTAAQFSTFFGTLNATLGTFTNRVGPIAVHGIVCPDGQTCNGESNANKNSQVITARGGVKGDICRSTGATGAADCSTYPTIPSATQAIINASIGAAGYRMQKPPIGASVKVAVETVTNMATCNRDDIPRSRQNGFDFDGINRTISFYGDCRPTGAMNAAAVSYRYWIDTTPNPGGNPPPCSADPFYDPMDPDFCQGRLACNLTANQCECPADCGGNGPPGMICDTNVLVCDFVCTQDCGGTCSQYQQCNTTSCACECKQTASCPVGYRFQNGSGVCGCVCDTAALNCGATYDADPNVCACVCKPNCGGCETGKVCNASTCACTGGIN